MKRIIRERYFVLLFFLVGLTVLTGCTGGLPSASWFGVSAAEDTVYLAANEQVIALNLESRAELWRFPPEADKEMGPFYTPPLLTDDEIFVGGFGDGRLYAVSRDSGAQEWVVETEAAIVDGAVSTDGGIVVGNNEGEVFLISKETREKQLLFKADEPIWATPLVDEIKGRVYVASMDHHLYAVDIESGEQIWAFEAGGALAGTPVLYDGAVYFGAINSAFYAVNAETGEELWPSFETDGWVWGGPLVDGDTVYFGDMAGKLYALDAADGSQRWAFEADGGIRVAPVQANDVDGQSVLYFGTREGKVYALGAEDGVQKWAQPLTGAIYSQPVIHGTHLLVSPHNAKVQLVALDPESGAELWSYSSKKE